MKHFIRRLDHRRITNAIREAEKKTSGPVRVYVSHRPVADPMQAARHAFEALGIQHHRHRRGLVVFVAPEARKFAVFADSGIHAERGDEFWEQVTAVMKDHFKGEDFTAGIVSALEMLAR